MNPKISLITNSYNNKEEVQKMYESVLPQKHMLYELIFCDDGSNDGTWELIKELVAIDDGIKKEGITHAKKGSRYPASLNNGFRKATGDVIFSVNSDSYLSNNTLSELSKEFIKGSVGCAIRKNVDTEGNFISWDWRIEDGQGSTKQIYPTKMTNFWAAFTGNGMICDRQAMQSIGYWDEAYSGYGRDDWDFYMRAGFEGFPMIQYNSVVIHNILHEGDINRPDNPDNISRFETKVRKYLK